MSTSGVARNSGHQHIHYIRKRISFATVNLANGIQIGTLPARAFVHRVQVHTVAAFNSGTSDTIQLGSSAAGVDILAAQSIHATGLSDATSAAGLGLAVTDSADIPVFAKWVGVGAVPSAGDVTIVVEFSPDNDG